MTDWRWPNFTAEEMRCKETGELAMDPGFMDRLQKLRVLVGRPLVPTSGYRSIRHSVEAKKIAEMRRKGIDPETMPRTHARGRACDIAADGVLRFQIAALAPGLGFRGIGVAESFIHLDDWDGPQRPFLWRY